MLSPVSSFVITTSRFFLVSLIVATPPNSAIIASPFGFLASKSSSTQGLPRVEELFEARKPKGLAIIAEFGGVATIKDTKKKREVVITNDETGESKAYLIPYGSRIKIMDGAVLEAGDELTEGSVNPHDLLKIKGMLCFHLFRR